MSEHDAIELAEAEEAVKKAQAALDAAKAKAAYQHYPRYVEPHLSHIVTIGGQRSTPHFPEFHIDRATDVLSVLVNDAEHEAKAKAAKE